MRLEGLNFLSGIWYGNIENIGFKVGKNPP